MKEILKQFLTIWRAMKPIQKGASLAILLFVGTILSFLILKSSSASFVPLYSGRTLSKTELNEVRTYLEHFSFSYQEDPEKGILVAPDTVERIRMELAAAGIPKQEQGKGFELFDTNTWIKGEKELQVLEMRALKGQLEKDLAGFEQIKNASVILDMPQGRTFNGPKYKTKASVILTLMPNAHLSSSQLRAITNHLAGAVRGLEPNMIAISDTKGKLYKAIDPEGEEHPIRDAQLAFEEHVEDKITALLNLLVGEERFYSTVQAVLDRETEEVLSLSMGVVIDRAVLAETGDEAFKGEVERQLAAVAKGYGVEVLPIVDFVPFEKKRKVWIEHKEKGSYAGLFLTLFFIVLAVISLFPLFRWYREKKEESDEELFQLMEKIDLEKLMGSLRNEDPAVIAMMLSYVEPKRAEQMIAALNDDLQEAVLFHLSELEKGETK